MNNIKIYTCNSMYKDGECIGGYHEIHDINALNNTGQLCATINSIIDNNKAYDCSTVLENVVVCCERKIADVIEEYYKFPYKGVVVSTDITI